MALPVMQAFWHGRVSTMERLSVASFLAHGHEVHVYSYDVLSGLPAGAVARDAADVLPPRSRGRRTVFRDSRGSVSNFSDIFRYKLLLEGGGWWIDLDVVCLKPFEFPDEYVFVNEPSQVLGSAVFRVPAGSEVMAYSYERCLALGRKRKVWLTTGPALLGEAVQQCGLTSFVVDSRVFMPYDWSEWETALDADRVWDFEPETHAVHLWSSLWSMNGRDRDSTYPSTCLYEILKRRYL